LIELRFHGPLNTKQVISETFDKPISWLSTCTEKTISNTTKQTTGEQK